MDEERRNQPDEDFDMPGFDETTDYQEDSPLTPEQLQEAIERYKAWLRARKQEPDPSEPPFHRGSHGNTPHHDRHAPPCDEPPFRRDDDWDDDCFRRGDTAPFTPFGRHAQPWERRRSTNRYTIRADGYHVPDTAARLQQLAYAVWAVGVIGALLTASLTCSGLLTCFWILAAAGVLGALIWLLAGPVQHLAQICSSIQFMTVEQTEFAEDE